MQGIAHPLRSRAVSLPRPARPGRRALVVAVVLVGLGLAYLGLRDASVLRVREVTLTGLPAAQEGPAREALRAAAGNMTTLHVREDRLRAALAPYAAVARLEVDARLPRTLAVAVVDRPAVGALHAGGRRVPVAADGGLLRDLRATGPLPTVAVDAIPAGDAVASRRARAAVAVLGGAPAALRPRLRRVRSGARGLQVDLRSGPALIFGSASRRAAKWLAATRVLADAEARGATYLDLRVPERTAAGGVGPVVAEDPGVPAPDDADAPGAPAGPGAAPTPSAGAAAPSGPGPDGDPLP